MEALERHKSSRRVLSPASGRIKWLYRVPLNQAAQQPEGVRIMTGNEKLLVMLRDARYLVKDEDKWIQGTMARDISGDDVEAHDRGARSFCSAGAIRAAVTKFFTGLDIDFCPYYNELDDVLGSQLFVTGDKPDCLQPHELDKTGCVISFNDDNFTTHKDVLSAFDRAIESLEERINQDASKDSWKELQPSP